MREKQKLLLTTAICLVVSAVALTSFTFAWFIQDRSVSNIVTFNAGDSEVSVEARLYERRFPTTSGLTQLGYFIDASNYLNAVQISNTNGNIQVDFANNYMLDYDLLNAYSDENSLEASGFPSYYMELKVHKTTSYGFLGVKMVYQSIPDAFGTELNLSSIYPFAYRTLYLNNSATTPMVGALTTQMTALEARPSALFFNSATQRAYGITLFDVTDLAGAPISSTAGLAPQRYIPGFATKVSGANVFATSILLQIYVDPLSMVKYIREHTAVMNTSLRFGIGFSIKVQYSNNPILA